MHWSDDARVRARVVPQVVALVRGKQLWVANAGDSRCVVSRRGRALALTHDHKPTDAAELARISQARRALSYLPGVAVIQNNHMTLACILYRFRITGVSSDPLATGNTIGDVSPCF